METIFFAIIVFFASTLFSMIGLGGAIFYVPFFYWVTGISFFQLPSHCF